MKKGITHKEITLALGIIVAMIVLVTLWVHQPSEHAYIPEFIEVPKVALPEIGKTIIQVTTEIIFK